jgi:transposase
MQPVIGCDAHKKFSVFVSIDQHGKASRPVRVDHDRDLYCHYLRTLPANSEIALEATGHWYWIVDAMEEAGHRPHLANPFEAKRRMAKSNKTDALDAKGLAIWPRLLTGCCGKNKPIAPHSRALPADTRLRPRSGKRETRLVSNQTSG